MTPADGMTAEDFAAASAPTPPPAPRATDGMTAEDFAAATAPPPGQPAPPPPAPPPPPFDPSAAASGFYVPLEPTKEAVQQEQQTTDARNRMLVGANTRASAPVDVRLGVGAADDPGTRLARLRQWYPDAQPLPGTNNFVYTDENGRRQTYAPMGWRVPGAGDLASIVPDVAEGVGAIGGGIGGTFVGGPGVGTAVGAGSGAVAGRELAQRGVSSLLGLPDQRTPEQQVRDAGITALANGLLQPVAGVLGRGVAVPLLTPGAETGTQQAARALDDAGVTRGLLDTLPMGVAAESPGGQRAESALMQTLTGQRITQLYKDLGTKLTGGVQDIASNVAAPATVPTADTFGATVQDIAKTVIGNQTAEGTALKDAVNNQIGQAPVYFNNLKSVLTGLKAKISKTPESTGYVTQPAIDRATSVMNDAAQNGGTLPLNNVLAQRTLTGAIPDWAASGGADAMQSADMKSVNLAIRQDLYDAAQAAGGPGNNAGLQALNDYDSFWKRWLNGPNDSLNRLSADTTRSETLQQLMTQNSPKAMNDVMNLWHAASPEQRGQLQAGVLQTLGDDGRGGFDMAAFGRRWAALNQPQRNLVFGSGPGSSTEALNNLATVQSAVRDATMTRGHSNSAAVWAFMTVLGSIGGHVLAGEPGEALGAGASALGAPWAAARLLQSQPFVKAMTGAWGVNPARAGWWGDAVGRLAAAGEADPSIKPLVNQLVAGLPPEPQTDANGRVVQQPQVPR